MKSSEGDDVMEGDDVLEGKGSGDDVGSKVLNQMKFMEEL